MVSLVSYVWVDAPGEAGSACRVLATELYPVTWRSRSVADWSVTVAVWSVAVDRGRPRSSTKTHWWQVIFKPLVGPAVGHADALARCW
jgi:hypothetical protein